MNRFEIRKSHSEETDQKIIEDLATLKPEFARDQQGGEKSSVTELNIFVDYSNYMSENP